MPFSSILYKFFIGPVELFFEVLFAWVYRHTLNPAISIVFLSLAMNLLVLPLYRRADSIQAEERAAALRLKPGIDHIKACFKGDERFMMLQTYYRQNNYMPYYSLRNSVSLLLQIPFFIAAYHYLSHLSVLNGAALGIIRDLGSPDSLIKIGAYEINALPVIMTLINIISGAIYTKVLSKTQKFQLYGMALIFLVLLYNSPAGLVFYWTLNNLFSLLKNIVYKLRNPKGFLRYFCSAIGIIMLALLVYKGSNLRWRIATAGYIFVICLQLPLFFDLLKINISKAPAIITKPEKHIFLLSSLFLCLLTGVLIPSAVISSSTAEFVEQAALSSPLRYLASSFLLASGTFLLWFRIFYSIATPRFKKLFSFILFSFSFIAVLNYVVFSPGYGMMNNLLKYDMEPNIPKLRQLSNIAVSILILLISYVLVIKRSSSVRSLIFSFLIAVVVMSGVNIHAINKEFNDIKDNLAINCSADFPSIRLNKKGKNVIVIMADRAIGKFFPYLLYEKPILKDQFNGFTYYPNTFSYGGQTITSSPSLYGGYEYIPDELQKRNDTLLKDKQNEALRVMPVTFAESGYDVTVFDPSYAGYSHIPDLNIYADHPQIKAFNTCGKFSEKDYERLDFVRNRNFFLHGFFRISPLVIQNTVYDGGRYNEIIPPTENKSQVLCGFSKAEGNNEFFLDWYNVLKALPSITEVKNSSQNTFTLLVNEATHGITLLQKPMYEPMPVIDNTAYDRDMTITNIFDKSKATLTAEDQVMHYHVNMAAMLQLGKWFDYLRENNLFDNTRIIVVSDHGFCLTELFGTKFSKVGDFAGDILLFNPILLVKDFESKALEIDHSFMSSADTPSIAFNNLITNPINPATGTPISNDTKFNPMHYLCISEKWNPAENPGKTFDENDLTWFCLKGDNIFDFAAWSDGRSAD